MITIKQHQNNIISALLLYLQVCSWTLFVSCYDNIIMQRVFFDISVYLAISLMFQFIKYMMTRQVQIDANDFISAEQHENINLCLSYTILATSVLMNVFYFYMYVEYQDFKNSYIKDIILIIITYSQNYAIIGMFHSINKQFDSFKFTFILNIVSIFQLVLALVNGPKYNKPLELLFCNFAIMIMLLLGVVVCLGFIYGYITSTCSCKKFEKCEADKPLV
jgi:hypothetical protein